MPRQPQTELEVIIEGEPNIFALPPEDCRSFVAQCAERVMPYITRYYKRKQYTSKDTGKKQREQMFPKPIDKASSVCYHIHSEN